MNLEVILPLFALALIDSTSIGTLLVPIWLLTAPGQIRGGRIILYLAAIGLFYWLVGIVLMTGFTSLSGLVEGIGSSRPVLWIQLAIGVGLFAVSFRFDSKKENQGSPGRIAKWRQRVTAGETGATALVGLALLSGALELATMIPYLGAIGILSSADLAWGESVLVLAVYCVVMVAPAILLLGGRLAFGSLLQRPLAAIERWMSKNAASTTGWILGIVGFFVALDAISRLGLMGLRID